MAQTRTVHYLSHSGPSHYDFAGGDGQVTVGEKRASVAGQMARGTLGAGKRDRCRRGKACGLTCIAGNEDCIIDFPEPVQGELTRMAQAIMQKKIKAGKPVEAGSEEDIRLGKAVGDVGRHLTYESPSKGKGFGTTTQGLSRTVSPSEIRYLKENSDKIGNSEFNATARKAWQTHVQSKGVKLSKDDLETIYDSLPAAAKTQLNNGGNPGKGAFYAKDKDGNDITNGSSGTRDRGLAVLDMYFKQGGTDAYKWGSNRVYSPMDLDVEHIRPVAKGGLDHPSNWVLARAGAQRQRADEELRSFIKSLPDPDDKAAMKAYYSNEIKKLQAQAAVRDTFGGIRDKLSTMSDAEFLKNVPVSKGMKNVFRDPKTGKADSFFQQTGLDHPAPPQARTKYTQPAAFSKAYGLVRKNNDELAPQVRNETREIWNNQWMKGKITTPELINKWIDIYRTKLSPEAFALVEPEMKKAGQALMKNYPTGSPSYTGGGSASSVAPAAEAKAGGTKQPRSQKEAEAALDDLLKSL